MTASNQSSTGLPVLVIDDDPDILTTVAFALKQLATMSPPLTMEMQV